MDFKVVRVKLCLNFKHFFSAKCPFLSHLFLCNQECMNILSLSCNQSLFSSYVVFIVIFFQTLNCQFFFYIKIYSSKDLFPSCDMQQDLFSNKKNNVGTLVLVQFSAQFSAFQNVISHEHFQGFLNDKFIAQNLAERHLSGRKTVDCYLKTTIPRVNFQGLTAGAGPSIWNKINSR